MANGGTSNGLWPAVTWNETVLTYYQYPPPPLTPTPSLQPPTTPTHPQPTPIRFISQRIHDVIVAWLFRQNNVSTSFSRNNYAIVTSCVRWSMMYVLQHSEWLIRLLIFKFVYIVRHFIIATLQNNNMLPPTVVKMHYITSIIHNATYTAPPPTKSLCQLWSLV